MAGIQMTGLASGLDTETIITQLLNTERQPRTALTLKGSAAEAKATALKDISAKLNALKLAATAMRSAGTWGDTQTAESGDAAKVAVRTVAGAAPGGHTVTVTGLARGAQSVFDFAPPASGRHDHGQRTRHRARTPARRSTTPSRPSTPTRGPGSTR